MVECPQCGTRHENEQFCRNCGCALTGAPEQKERPASNNQVAPAQPVSPEVPIKLRAGRALAIFFGFIGGQFIGTVVVVIAGIIIAASSGVLKQDKGFRNMMEQPNSAALMLSGSYVIGAATMLIMAFLLVRNQLRDGSPNGAAWRTGTPAQLGMGALLGVLIAFLLILLMIWVIPPRGDIPQNLMFKAAMSTGVPRIFLVVSIVLLAPVIEELMFRGILFGGLHRSFGPFWAWSVTILLFVLCHIAQIAVYWPSLIGTVFVAVVNLWSRLRTRAVGPAVALHFIYNFIFTTIFIAFRK